MTKDGTCWLTGSYIFSFYLPLYIYVSWAVCVLVFAVFTMKVDMAERSKRRSVGRQMLSTMIVFTLGFIASWIWGIVFRIQEYISTPSVQLTLVSSFMLAFQGFLNLIIFADRVFQDESTVLRIVCCRKKLFPAPFPRLSSGLQISKRVKLPSSSYFKVSKNKKAMTDIDTLRQSTDPLDHSEGDVKLIPLPREGTIELPTMKCPKRAVSAL